MHNIYIISHTHWSIIDTTILQAHTHIYKTYIIMMFYLSWLLAWLWHVGAAAFAMPSLGLRWGLGRKVPKAKPKTAPKTSHRPVPPALPKKKDLGSRWGLRPAKSSRSQPSQLPQPSQPSRSSKTATAEDPVKVVGPVDESEARHCARHVKTVAGKRCARCKPLGQFCFFFSGMLFYGKDVENHWTRCKLNAFHMAGQFNRCWYTILHFICRCVRMSAGRKGEREGEMASDDTDCFSTTDCLLLYSLLKDV